MAALSEVPFAPYYGSVDATPLFVLLAGLYVERTGDDETLRELWPAIEAALRWIDGAGDPDRDGFVEYQRASEHGLANQGWKDSVRRDLSCRWPSGRGLHRACRSAGLCVRRQAARGALRRAARQCRPGAASWRPRRSGLPSVSKRRSGARNSAPMRWRSTAPSSPAGCARSNAGQLLFTGIVREDRARHGRRRSDAAGFLHRLGHPHGGARRSALQSDVLSRRLDMAARQCADRAGLCALRPQSIRSRRCSRRCSTPPAIWICGGCRNCSAGSSAKAARPDPVSGRLRAAGLGERDAVHAAGSRAWPGIRRARGEIRLRNPRLPAFLNEVILRELQLGPSSVDLRVRRHGDDVSLEVLRRRGQIQVSIVLAH